ncbi:hypothetical protein DMH03_29445 [Amycolatopsis sp. WAC 01376]|uniref:hypothetical protein n=1 Tax=Amycolatopsis sp. WAC 01376 TaxID=2203195 RepID=UPI000F779A3A|nr:hypothetical protein [Amycolatopsis sp. WAC 01376]RSM57345.1 hypothetical protein DMH03_29445 [Amycolatopsis sp. WAC 01376]
MSQDPRREEWAALCARLRRLAGDANWFALRPDFDDLTAATRAGEDTLDGWRALETKLARLAEAELNQMYRHAESGNVRTRPDTGSEARHGCPRELCDRVAPAPAGAPPKCPLFGVPMHELH